LKVRFARWVDRSRDSDDRVRAWYAVADHPALKPAYEVEGALLPAVLQRLTDLQGLERLIVEMKVADARGRQDG
jgi:hypothetical protein